VAGQVSETNRLVEKLTAEMLIPEDGEDERRKASEYCSNSMTLCMKDGAFSALMKVK
jgi:hypothetical protein